MHNVRLLILKSRTTFNMRDSNASKLNVGKFKVNGFRIGDGSDKKKTEMHDRGPVNCFRTVFIFTFQSDDGT